MPAAGCSGPVGPPQPDETPLAHADHLAVEQRRRDVVGLDRLAVDADPAPARTRETTACPPPLSKNCPTA